MHVGEFRIVKRILPFHSGHKKITSRLLLFQHAATTKSEKEVSHWLDKAQDKYDKPFINDIKATLRVLVLFIPIPIFWALFDQQVCYYSFNNFFSRSVF